MCKILYEIQTFITFPPSECTTSSCSPSVGGTDPNLFKDFKRSLRWDISVPERTVLTLNFPGDGLKEISGAENCHDGYQYLVSTTKSDRNIKTNSYCKGRTVSQLDLYGVTTVTVDVPKGGDVDQTAFSVTAAPRGKLNVAIYVTENIFLPYKTWIFNSPKETS